MSRSLPLAITFLLVLSGCDRAEPVTYTIPKEERAVRTPGPATTAPTAMPAAPSSSQMQVLPGMAEAAQAAPEFTYRVPDGWEEFAAQSVRKANFRVSGEQGSAEISVTVFPGDVGGKLANINRWRGQIGLDPIEMSGMREVTRPLSISNHMAMLVILQGPQKSILGGILNFHGSTWFFKMLGDSGVVAEQADAMESFLASVQIEDTQH